MCWGWRPDFARFFHNRLQKQELYVPDLELELALYYVYIKYGMEWHEGEETDDFSSLDGNSFQLKKIN